MVVRLLPSQAPALSLYAAPWTILDQQSAPRLLQVRQPLCFLCAVGADLMLTSSLLTCSVGVAANTLVLHAQWCPPQKGCPHPSPAIIHVPDGVLHLPLGPVWALCGHDLVGLPSCKPLQA